MFTPRSQYPRLLQVMQCNPELNTVDLDILAGDIFNDYFKVSHIS